MPLLSKKEFRSILDRSPDFDAFLQNIACFVIGRFAKIGENPPDGRIEALLNAIIGSDYEKTFHDIKAVEKGKPMVFLGGTG